MKNENKMDQLTALSEAAQNEIDILTTQRKALYRLKQKGPNEQIILQIESINQSIKLHRREVKPRAQIEADIPRVREKQRTLSPPQKAPEKQRPAHRRNPLAR